MAHQEFGKGQRFFRGMLAKHLPTPTEYEKKKRQLLRYVRQCGEPRPEEVILKLMKKNANELNTRKYKVQENMELSEIPYSKRKGVDIDILTEIEKSLKQELNMSRLKREINEIERKDISKNESNWVKECESEGLEINFLSEEQALIKYGRVQSGNPKKIGSKTGQSQSQPFDPRLVSLVKFLKEDLHVDFQHVVCDAIKIQGDARQIYYKLSFTYNDLKHESIGILDIDKYDKNQLDMTIFVSNIYGNATFILFNQENINEKISKQELLTRRNARKINALPLEAGATGVSKNEELRKEDLCQYFKRRILKHIEDYRKYNK